MKKSTSAVLLSAFLFPGMGHVYLKKYVTGIVLAGISFASIYYLVSKAIDIAVEISKKIEAGEVLLDESAISQLATQFSNTNDAQIMNIATTVFIICWLVGIVDAYRLGRLQDKNSVQLNDQ